jgi:hypothetical protein
MASREKGKSCFWCHSRGLRRLSRSGFFARHILPLLGVYPWECMSCRRRLFLRDSGHHRTSAMTGV